MLNSQLFLSFNTTSLTLDMLLIKLKLYLLRLFLRRVLLWMLSFSHRWIILGECRCLAGPIRKVLALNLRFSCLPFQMLRHELCFSHAVDVLLFADLEQLTLVLPYFILCQSWFINVFLVDQLHVLMLSSACHGVMNVPYEGAHACVYHMIFLFS